MTTPASAAVFLDAAATTKLAAAKLWLVSTESPSTCGDLPYLASALYALVPLGTDRVASMTLDERWRLYVNPAWLAAAELDQVAVGMVHLVWHALADHGSRARDVEVTHDTASQWTKAADATVAEMLEHSRLRSSLISPRGYDWDRGRSAEEYYARASGLPARVMSSAPDPFSDPEAVDASCGSACDGHSRGYELPAESDLGGVDQHDAEAIRRRVAIEWRAHRPRGWTSVPSEFARWVEQVLEPTVPWQQVLASAVRRGLGWAYGHTDYTYARISRRQSATRSVVLPALRRHVPEVAIVLDTSGSMDDGLLAQALAEIDGVLTSSGVAGDSVTVLSVDCAVHDVGRVRRASDVTMGGGGGTDMGVGIDAALALRPRPQLIVVLTDGDTPWPTEAPAVPVIAAIVGRGSIALPETPPWASTVRCD